MACFVQQTGTLTYGTLSAIWDVNDGFNYDGKSVEPIEATVDTDVVTKFCSSDLPTFGTFTATAFCEGQTDFDALVGGSGNTLTWTWPVQEGDTNAQSKTGDAILLSSSIASTKGDLMKASLTFQWTGSVVTTVGS